MDGESQNAQDARVEQLWRTLDTRKEGQLDLNGLKQGLRKMDHPLKHADQLLHDVMKVVDTNGDGRIQYSEFRRFIEQTERELWQLFKSIDRDENGQLDKTELQAAFKRAGLIIPKSKFEHLFSQIDADHNGAISFGEWRDFLLFLPAPVPNLKAVLSYYSSTVTLNAEGDVHLSEETVQGLGRNTFFTTFFGVFFAVARPRRSPERSLKPYFAVSALTSKPQSPRTAQQRPDNSQPCTFPWDPGEVMADKDQNTRSSTSSDETVAKPRRHLLTEFLPEPGYFLAGGVAGVISRTATAPLDRLKVYLIAQTGATNKAVHAAKTGAPLQASKLVARPLVDALKALWGMGGIKSMFAGNGLNVVKVMPESAIKFGSYEGSKRALARLEGHEDPKALKPWTQFCAAGMGGMISQFCIYPLDTLKFRMQCETTVSGPSGNLLILTTLRKMYATSGLRAFYRGLPLGLLGMFPYSAIDLTTFEYLKAYTTSLNASRLSIHPSDPEAAPSNLATAGIGAFSGALGASVVYPVNLLRTRLQSQGTAIHPRVYDGWWDCAMKTVGGEGWKGLWKGLTPNLLKVVPAVSITYVVYDNSKKVLGLM